MKILNRLYSNYKEKQAIRSSVFMLNKRLMQINQEMAKTQQEVTLPIRDLALVMQINVKYINQMIRPTGILNCSLIDSLVVRLSTGEKVLFTSFCSRYNKDVQYLERVTNLDLTIHLSVSA